MGKVYQVTDQEGCSEYFYYDAEGRLETRTDRNGNRETTHYNMDGNLTYRRAEDRKGRNPVVSRYVYYPDGKLKQAEGGGITYDYAYTENGMLKSKSASGKPLFEILDLLIDEYGVIGVWYTHGVPDFSPFAVEEFKLYGMQGGERGRDSYNFPQSDEIMGAKYGMTKQQFQNARENLEYTWHECNGMLTMQMIPSAINKYFRHMGGVGEINLLTRQADKTIWKMFPNWKK